MNKVRELNAVNFEDFISDGNTVVDFWAEWCGPCKIMGPHFDKVAEKTSGVKFAKVNVDENYELASQFQVMSIPTTIFFKNGEVVERRTGALMADALDRVIHEAFK